MQGVMKMSKTPGPRPLTEKEKEVLEFIESFVSERGIAPTFQEIKQNFGFASFNSVQRYLKQLQSKNYLHIPGDNQKRAIQVLHPSNSYSNLLRINSVKTTYPNTNQPKKEALNGSESHVSSSSSRVEPLSLPLLGRVAAGLPIEAFLNQEFVDVPPSLIRYPTKTFGLVVQGESMIEDGIFDGDIIFVEKQSYANNGQTIVATINNQATVKKFYLQNKKDIHGDPQDNPHSLEGPSKSLVELRPANSQMTSLWVEPDKVDIQGIVVALIRRM
jgi:repressor LexA